MHYLLPAFHYFSRGRGRGDLAGSVRLIEWTSSCYTVKTVLSFSDDDALCFRPSHRCSHLGSNMHIFLLNWIWRLKYGREMLKQVVILLLFAESRPERTLHTVAFRLVTIREAWILEIYDSGIQTDFMVVIKIFGAILKEWWEKKLNTQCGLSLAWPPWLLIAM